jgi:hypothetical protein
MVKWIITYLILDLLLISDHDDWEGDDCNVDDTLPDLWIPDQ